MQISLDETLGNILECFQVFFTTDFKMFKWFLDKWQEHQDFLEISPKISLQSLNLQMI